MTNPEANQLPELIKPGAIKKVALFGLRVATRRKTRRAFEGLRTATKLELGLGRAALTKQAYGLTLSYDDGSSNGRLDEYWDFNSAPRGLRATLYQIGLGGLSVGVRIEPSYDDPRDPIITAHYYETVSEQTLLTRRYPQAHTENVQPMGAIEALSHLAVATRILTKQPDQTVTSAQVSELAS